MKYILLALALVAPVAQAAVVIARPAPPPPRVAAPAPRPAPAAKPVEATRVPYVAPVIIPSCTEDRRKRKEC